MNGRNLLFIVLFFQLVLPSLSPAQEKRRPPFLNETSRLWADSVFGTMSESEKIGQLFTVPAFSNKDVQHVNEISCLISDYHVGGILFFQGGPLRQAELTNFYQEQSKIPLLISIDGEWGLSMRLDSTIRFPRQMTLSAMNNDSLVYEMGAEIGRQCKAMGIHVNFAPDIDINNNPLNPIINSRSFGEDPATVAKMGLQYMHGMQDQHVIACGKHFPGHGNTDSDSHYTLPVIRQDRASMDSIELLPFRELIDRGLGSVMVAHLLIPALDSTSGQASTLSEKIVTGLLQRELGFEGLIFTDALNMKGVSAYNNPGQLEFSAYQAGNDILLNAENVPLAAYLIHLAIQNCEIDTVLFNSRIKKILMAKHWVGLNRVQPISYTDLNKTLKNEPAEWLNFRLYEGTYTLLRNKNSILPFRNLEKEKIASLVINDSLNNVFQQTLNYFAPVSSFQISKDADDETIQRICSELGKYSMVIVSVHNTSTNAGKNFNITPQVSKIISELSLKTKTVTVVFGNAYVLSKIDIAEKCDGLLLAYEDTYLPQKQAAQVLFDAMSPTGRLPVTPSGLFHRNEGLSYPTKPSRLKFTLPEEGGLTFEKLARIDSLAIQGIKEGAYPGCQVLIARKGKVLYERSFGFLQYDSLEKVTNSHLYDIASITKITATALAVMMLVEQGEIDLNKKISRYLPEFKKSNKKDITLRELMAHQAGLQAWIPFYKETLENGKPTYNIYHPVPDLNYSLRVADSLFIKNDYPEKIWKRIVESEVKEKGTYLYSDLDIIIMQKIIEKVTHTTIDDFVNRHFYKPLGLHRLTFSPLKHFGKEELVPTEFDTVFRNQLIRGDVHDPAAAMMGGIAGHAGVFSNSASLAVIMQMLLNGGNYGGHRYFKKETIDQFTSRQFPLNVNRRGLIFDKPEYDRLKNGPTAKSASSSTFGHTGFTGTCAWADPEKELIFIFLSNRIHPSADNNKLATMNIRTDIQEAIYELLKDH